MPAPAVTSRVRRFDAMGELASPRRDEVSGFLFFEGKIGRTGVQEYFDGTGKAHRELRIPEEVFDPESMISFEQVPVTNAHPPELLTVDNAADYACGGTAGVREDGDWLVAPLSVWKREAITYIEAGRVELSNGYTCELDPTQDPELLAKWGPYDFIQRKIRGNHVALVDEARAGPEARLRLDSGDARMVALPHLNPAPAADPPTREPTPMPQIVRIDGHTFNVDDASAPLIQREIERVIEKLKADGTAAVSAEKQRADGLAAKLGIVKVRAARVIDIAVKRGERIDGMKARMMSCDECSGQGKVDEESCGYCGGSGKVRMHDEIKAIQHQEPDGDEASPDDEDHGDEEGDEEMLDADELETEAPEPKGKPTTDAKRRADAARDQRRKEGLALAKKRSDSMQRRITRAVNARVALEVQARRHLDADAKLDGVDALGVQKLVLAKLEPKLKLDGRSADFIANAYEVAVGRVDGDAPTAPSAIDRARGNPIPAPARGADRIDSVGAVNKARDDFAASRRDAWKEPAQAKK